MALNSHSTDVLVVGAGPAGLLAALQLARNGIQCILVERNMKETDWPKMDLTNCRSMELLRRLNVAEGWKEIGVSPEYGLDVLFSTGLAEGGEVFARWPLPSPEEWRKRIQSQNDGTQPYEAWIRGAQNLFEKYLRGLLESNPLVRVYYGMKFEVLHESDTGVESQLTHNSGSKHHIHSKYLIGCDGGGSRVRRCIGIESIGGPVPGAMYLIHFKSKDLSILHQQGRFWHLFLTSGTVVVSQDEGDTWTMHTPIEIGTDVSNMDPLETIRKGLGASVGKSVPVEIDEILVRSNWRPNIYIANQYTSTKGRVFLAGDSAHQITPTGGYGMNTAVGDSFDIGWKVAAVLKGYAGDGLLASYDLERRPVAIRNMEQSGKHWNTHVICETWAREAGQNLFSKSTKGLEVRERIRKFLEENDHENTDHGIELDYRYISPVIVADENEQEPGWVRSHYTPSTWPGARVPSVWLKDGKTNIFELLGSGPEYTIVDFTSDGMYVDLFVHGAKQLNIPLKAVQLSHEEHVRKIWEREGVLVRPDDHVAWRSAASTATAGRISSSDVREILKKVTGQVLGLAEAPNHQTTHAQPLAFTGTVNADRDSVEMFGSFQNS